MRIPHLLLAAAAAALVQAQEPLETKVYLAMAR